AATQATNGIDDRRTAAPAGRDCSTQAGSSTTQRRGRISKKSGSVLREGTDARYAMIQRHEQSKFPVTLMCRVLSVSCSGYYGWRSREPSARQRVNQALVADIHRLHQTHKGRIGAPRMVKHLHEEGQVVGKQRVAKLMRLEGLRGKAKRKFKATTNSNHNLPVAPNLLQQDFNAGAPNQKWV